ncbi:MAG: hypothetical protein AMK70_06655, partial [Nitrospira bacterium SG8_35_1]
MKTDQRRTIARSIFTSAVKSVQPDSLISNTVTLEGDMLRISDTILTLRPDQKVYVFGSGKASLGMAKSLLTILEERVADGVIVSNHLTGEDLAPLKTVLGSHPVPDEKSITGAELLIDGLSRLDSDDFFIYLLSGGSSALIEKPVNPIT